MPDALRLRGFDERDLLRFGALRGVSQQERSVDTLQRSAKRFRVIEIALRRAHARFASDLVARAPRAQHHGELDTPANQRVGQQGADHSGCARDEQTGRHWQTSTDESATGVPAERDGPNALAQKTAARSRDVGRWDRVRASGPPKNRGGRTSARTHIARWAQGMKATRRLDRV